MHTWREGIRGGNGPVSIERTMYAMPRMSLHVPHESRGGRRGCARLSHPGNAPLKQSIRRKRLQLNQFPITTAPDWARDKDFAGVRLMGWILGSRQPSSCSLLPDQMGIGAMCHGGGCWSSANVWLDHLKHLFVNLDHALKASLLFDIAPNCQNHGRHHAGCSQL